MKISIISLPILLVLRLSLSGQGAPRGTELASPIAATLVAPFYPALKQVPAFQPPAVAADQWELQFKEGAALQTGNFDTTESLDGIWKISGLSHRDQPFSRDEDLHQGWHKREFDDSSWDSIAVPLDWYQKYPKFRHEKAAPYVKGWYRKKIMIPQAMQARRVLLKFDVAGYEAALFVNGIPMGSHHGDFTSWTVDITKAVKFGEEAVLALRVFSDFGPKWGVPTAAHVYGSQWSISNIKAGLWQSASISYVSPLRIKQVLISPNFEKSSLDLNYVIVNDTAETRLIRLRAMALPADQAPKSGTLVDADLGVYQALPGETTGKAVLPLHHPVPWSPDHPQLYNLFLVLDGEGKALGGRVERFGFRQFKASGNAFYLNGDKIYLFGANLPSVRFGGLGLTREAEMAKVKNVLQELRSQGYNMIRTAHAPVPSFILDMADELGIMVYDEWAWAFTNTLDPSNFESNNLTEITEWIERDYNHPSVVMWSCGNEVHYEKPAVKEQLNKAVAKVRELDHSKRPVSVFSGAAYSFGKDKLDTDFLDLHTYIGASLPWTQWTNFVPGKMFKEFIYPTYGEGEQLKMPLVVWETVGFSWGEQSDPSYVSDDIHAYAKQVAKKSTWAQPNTIGYSGSLGVAASLDSKRSLLFGRNLYGKRIAEFIRRDIEHFQGFAPWFPLKSSPAAILWNQPVFCGLRGSNDLPPRNVFAGKTYQEELYLVNSTASPLAGISAKITLMSPGGHEESLAHVPLHRTPAFSRETQPVSLAIPKTLMTGFHQVRIVVSHDGRELSRNFYDVYVASQAILNDPINPSRKVGLLASDDLRTEKILMALGIHHSSVREAKDLQACQLLIVPAASKPHPMLVDSNALAEIKRWIRAGGSLLVLEQEYPGKDGFGQVRIKKDNPYADLVLPGHPAFNGLSRDNFDTWDHAQRGVVMRFPFANFSLNTLVTRGAYPKEVGVPSAACEGTLGAGRIFQSQLSAVDLWGLDSSASRYMRNLITYCVGDQNPYPKTEPWPQDASSPTPNRTATPPK